MTKFKLLSFALLLSLLVILTACGSEEKVAEANLKICPQCHMELPKSNIHTAILNEDDDNHYFDDPGCLILWANSNKIDLKNADVKIFSNDTKKYIDANKAFYRIDEKTPMLYGFSAYENTQKDSINFDEVIIRMLRGEHMANPKIRKHILGY